MILPLLSRNSPHLYLGHFYIVVVFVCQLVINNSQSTRIQAQCYCSSFLCIVVDIANQAFASVLQYIVFRVAQPPHRPLAGLCCCFSLANYSILFALVHLLFSSIFFCIELLSAVVHIQLLIHPTLSLCAFFCCLFAVIQCYLIAVSHPWVVKSFYITL